ncbi:acetyl-CoA hydrolase/transferase family protein [Leptospira wolffii]|uniref:4-hydroxybutyrate CoA-transferase n=1 Tax=Leptospira wolffii TaxID=409998 RepID=A0A2M9Z8C7_9LEPT|nr:acetyl-CoA hydrolase/transferase C-terminal domain-containing protein [Leptospira wolffii]PJZ64678.1 4-hydroxybutyrate CoA-transferase [Leptospira wolffii]TGK55890.1 acetyl-CoA hydrolase/transferase family protein [Leptospira wolffii]TGK75759.1 acetyl-CoA hydrolase/transferase family protein [Leptospira wolffii]TGK75881.1 acetyl-CoA hydrolase/transferase family protein [Leptospira wolffii]TGL27513.1 acetyl-CoA hydrolase/transferase family protein [Leptospira wolffii]
MGLHFISAEEALKDVKNGQRIFIHSVFAAPSLLVRALGGRASELKDIEIVHIHTEGEVPYASEGMEKSFRTNALFVGANMRKAVEEGRADYLPIFLSECPSLFRKGILPIDVALISVSPPDSHGFCSLGVSVEISKAAVDSAKIVIAQVNRFMPRTHGDGMIHMSKIAHFVEGHIPLLETPSFDIDPIEQRIGEHIASLVEDGATLQMGIGAIPNAVLSCLGNHKNLGIHTEMFSDGVIPLAEKGIVNGSLKHSHPGKIVTGFVMGTRKLYDFVNDNPETIFLDIGYINDTDNIRKNPKVTAINSAIEVDLTGQICADSIGIRQYSGVGGQMDFIRGASLSEGGKPIIALPSTTSKGESRIVPVLKPGASVTTTRAHVHYVVTEYGAVNLYGKNLRQRAKALIELAHPSHRDSLSKSAAERFKEFGI